jgi:hypothetical protein
MRGNQMKRYLGFLLAFVLLGAVVAVAACPISAAKTTGGVYKIDMSGKGGYYSSINSNGYYYYPASGHKFAIFDITLTNVNAPNLYMGNPNYFKLSTSSGMAYSYSSKTFLYATPMTGVDHTTPGESVRGIIVFEIYSSDTATQMLYNDGQNWALNPISPLT